MKVGIVGAGRMGQALGKRWARAGHEVTVSFSHDGEKLAKIASEFGHGAKAGTPAEAVDGADAVLVAVQWGTLGEALAQAGSLEAKTVLTCTIPMTDDDGDLAIGHTTSGAEEIARRSGANVVAIFDTVTSELINDEVQVAHMHPDVIYCGDDDGAKGIAEQLARDAGFRPLDAGPLTVARYLEPFGLVIAKLAYDQELGETLGYRIVLPGKA